MVSSNTGPGGSVGGGRPVQSFNNHGQVKIQIDQQVSLERQAFNATLEIVPAVARLDNFTATIAIQDTNGQDASAQFVVTPTQLPPSPITGPATMAWLIIPKESAGGTQPDGLQYTVAAHIAYAVAGSAHTFDTAPETITVTPLPRLQIEYKIPFVVMADLPFDLHVEVTNVGHGPANSLTIASAQPRIIENLNNIPITFRIDGSSATGNTADFQPDVLTIQFPTIAPGATVMGSWRMHTTKRGFFIDFTSTLTHRTINGKELDPLIEEVKLSFVPAVGGRITQACNLGPFMVELLGTTLQATTSANGDYYITNVPPRSLLDVPPMSYFLDVSQNGDVLTTKEIDVLADQPTDFVDLFADNSRIDTDEDGMPDCYELAHSFDRHDPADASQDSDNDALTNVQEFQHGTDPFNPDTDGDGFLDGVEVASETNPRDFRDFPQLRANVYVGSRTVYLTWDPFPSPDSNFRYEVGICVSTATKDCFNPDEPDDRADTVPPPPPHRPAESFHFFGDNDVLYRFTLFVVRDDVTHQLWNQVFARPGEFLLGQRPPRPVYPVLFAHGICPSELLSNLPFFDVNAGSWDTVGDILTSSLGWNYGGTLSYREIPNVDPRSHDPETVGIIADGDFYTVTFGNCQADYASGAGRIGLWHQADEVAAFIRTLRRQGVTRSIAIVAHSMGGISVRSYLVDNPSAASEVSDFITYSSPHWGASFASLGQFVSQGAEDLNFVCRNGSLDFTANSFFEDLRKKSLPDGMRYFVIRGHSHNNFFNLPAHRINTEGCLSEDWDGIIPIDSADFGRVPPRAPVGQQPIVLNNTVPVLTTNRTHTHETEDAPAILCALSPNCLIARVLSPVDIEIIAPDGRMQSRGFASIPGASYMQLEEENGHETATVIIPFPLAGDYRINAIPKPGTLPSDSYTIEVTSNGVTEAIAQNVRIQDTPAQGYTVTVSPPNQVPIANAGAGQTKTEGSVVTLNGAASSDPDGALLTYTWTQISGPAVTLSDPHNATPTFTAPQVGHAGATLSFQLVVSDGLADSAPAVVMLTIERITTPNEPPIANAGPAQITRLGSLVTLDGTDSSDPDAGPEPLLFIWTQTAGPAATLNPPDTATPTFRPTMLDTYTFNLVVNDGEDDSAPVSVTITVPKLGDIDLDGDIDQNDLNLLLAARNKPANGPNDLRDLDGDGVITALDARKLTLLCTRPRCATR